MRHTMTDDDLDAFLHGISVTPVQRGQLHEAYELSLAARGGQRQQFAAMAQIILGDATVESLTRERQAAVASERNARQALYGAIRWAHLRGVSANKLRAATGVARGTISQLVDR